MTHAEQILQAVASLVGNKKDTIFTRAEVRHQANINAEDWNASYNPFFRE